MTDKLREALEKIIKECHSHLDGHFYFDDFKGRNTLDIKMRRDAVETWHEADWMTYLGKAIVEAKEALYAPTKEEVPTRQEPSEKEVEVVAKAIRAAGQKGDCETFFSKMKDDGTSKDEWIESLYHEEAKAAIAAIRNLEGGRT